jgi:hypothetical protein
MTPPVAALLQRLHGARRAFQSAIEERVAKGFATPDGTIRIPNRALIASAAPPA